jgi:predicted RNA binding protein YcfA (HicA-like mRNA interferase family)
VSPKLPALTGAELIAVLESQGWYVARVKGSHHVMRHPEIPDAIPVPVHGKTPLKRGTLSGILRNAGIDRDELVQLLGR